MAKFLLSLLVVCLTSTLLQATDPCNTTSVLAEPNTRSFEFVAKFEQMINGFCDVSVRPGWYRLKVDNKDVDLVTSTPSPGACNTLYPIWMNATIPQNVSQETAVEACVVSGLFPCAERLNIRVKNCGAYRVYYLQPPTVCPSGYCFHVYLPCSNGTSSESGTGPGCTHNFTKLPNNLKPAVNPSLGISTEDPNFEDLRFDCDFVSPDPGYFYDIVWRVNGNEVARLIKLPVANLSTSGQLLETAWKDDYTMGINVQCAIRARATPNGVPGPEHKSDTFFAGLKALNTSVSVKEGGKVKLHYQATVPIPCSKSFPCFVGFTDVQHAIVGGVCKRSIKGACGFYITSQKWNDTQELTITAEYDDVFGDRLSKVGLHSTSPLLLGPKNVWANVIPQSVIVNIQDTNRQIKDAYCHLYNDPHFRSFDGGFFDVHLPGEFVLYRHRTLPLEVRGFFQPCDSSSFWHPKCICGAAVRSGKQIFVWSKCKDNVAYRTTRVDVHGCTSKMLRVSTPDKGRNYKIELPTGMTVDINTGCCIGINPSPADVGQTLGLCGNFNGNKNDEYIDPDGVKHPNQCELKYSIGKTHYCVVNKYGTTWKITNKTESYYGTPKIDLGGAPFGRCLCKAPLGQISHGLTCDNVPPTGCGNVNPVVTEDFCTQLAGSPSRRRRRRAIGGDGLTDEEDPVFPSYNDTEFQVPQWTNGWTEAKAKAHCQTVFGQSPTHGACSQVRNLELDRIISSCVIDILLTGATEWTVGSLETYKQNCVSEVRRNTTLWVPEGNAPSVLDEVIKATCPGECSFRGNCTNGECMCEAGWVGDDCSIDATKPPDVTALPGGGLCDLQDRNCTETLVYGSKFDGSGNITCKFATGNEELDAQAHMSYKDVSIWDFSNLYTTIPHKDLIIIGTNGRAVDMIPLSSSEARFRHSGEISCRLPSDILIREADIPTGYHVSVRNNINNVYSAPRLFLPYLSEFFRCEITGLQYRCEEITNPKATVIRMIDDNMYFLVCRTGESAVTYIIPRKYVDRWDYLCSDASHLTSAGDLKEYKRQLHLEHILHSIRRVRY